VLNFNIHPLLFKFSECLVIKPENAYFSRSLNGTVILSIQIKCFDLPTWIPYTTAYIQRRNKQGLVTWKCLNKSLTDKCVGDYCNVSSISIITSPVFRSFVIVIRNAYLRVFLFSQRIENTADNLWFYTRCKNNLQTTQQQHKNKCDQCWIYNTRCWVKQYYPLLEKTY